MKRLDLIERKLQSIADKDVSEIVSREVRLPVSILGLSKAQRIDGINGWLNSRIKVLVNAKVLPESAIKDEINGLQVMLCDRCKKIKEVAESSPCAKDYETFIAIQLYRFSLGLFDGNS